MTEIPNDPGTVTLFMTSVGPNPGAVVDLLKEYHAIATEDAAALIVLVDAGEELEIWRNVPLDLAQTAAKRFTDVGAEVETR